MNRIAASAKELPDSSFLVFIALPVCYILRGLYLLTDYVNWYALLLIGSVSWAFGTMHFVLAQMCRKKENCAALFAGITAFLWGINVYLILHLDFSAATFFMILSFCLQFFFGKRSIGRNINMLLLLFFGCAWRYTSPMLVVIISLCLLLRYWEDKKILFKKALALVLMFLVVWVPILCTLAWYRNVNGYDTYFAYRNAWANVIDRQTIDVEAHVKELSEIGFSENDIAMTWRWLIGDTKAFKTENVEELYEMLPVTDKYNLNILQILILMLKTKWNWLIGFVFLGCLLCVEKEKKTIVLLAVFTFGLIAGYMVRQRVVERLTLPVYFIGVCFALFVLAENCNEKVIKLCRRRLINAVVFGSVALCFVGSCFWAVGFADRVKSINARREAVMQAFEKYTDEHDSIVLLSGPIGGSPSVPIRILEKTPEPPVCSSLGGWIYAHPYMNHMMNKNGLEEYTSQAFCALLLPDVYYVVKNENMVKYIQIFLQEHYGLKTDVEIVQQIEGYRLINVLITS